MGDKVLCALATLLRHQCRQGDIVCRLGGEEFIVVLPSANSHQGYVRLESLRADFANTLQMTETGNFQTTFSCGIASFPKDGANFAQLYQLADQALYYAKANGKNQVALYPMDHTAHTLSR